MRFVPKLAVLFITVRETEFAVRQGVPQANAVQKITPSVSVTTAAQWDILNYVAYYTVARLIAIAATMNSAVLARTRVVGLINAAWTKRRVAQVLMKKPAVIKTKWHAVVASTDA